MGGAESSLSRSAKPRAVYARPSFAHNCKDVSFTAVAECHKRLLKRFGVSKLVLSLDEFEIVFGPLFHSARAHFDLIDGGKRCEFKRPSFALRNHETSRRSYPSLVAAE